MSTQDRKPRIALMGEFSAGKSTLSNLLLGARPLPEKVTATRLSPVWMSKGTTAPYRVCVDGTEETIAIEDLNTIPVDETRVIRLFFDADILDVCDLIDFPGISDPNMSSDVWQRMLDEVDAILWCTHATQAWRQSEAAVWETIPEAVRARSALLITRFDKLTTERDRNRVLARLEKETDGLFAETFPISLTEALAAGDDYEAFEASGGIDFLQFFLQMVDDLHEEIAQTTQSVFAAHSVADVHSEVVVDVEEIDIGTEVLTEAEDSSVPLQASEPEQLNDPVSAEIPQDMEPDAEVVQEPGTPEPEAADDVKPRRVRPQVGETRRARPRRIGETIDMASVRAQSAPTAPKAAAQGVSELRAIFQEKPEADH